MFTTFDEVLEFINAAQQEMARQFYEIEKTAEFNCAKVYEAFAASRVSHTHFAGTTGYGYDDAGREVLERVFARIFRAEDALVRHSIASGTHALSLCLYACLRPGDTLLSVTGKPYDTLLDVIGAVGHGSLADYGIAYKQVEFGADTDTIINAIDDNTRAVWIQKSKGYNLRSSLTNEEIGGIVRAVKDKKRDVICIVDNCYGEFVEKTEPTEHGADLVAGSLIKNPGGGITPSGGYVAGRKDLVDMASYRLTAPGIGREVGATHHHNRLMFQGLYLAPHTVSQNMKASVLASYVFEKLGFNTHPRYDAPRGCTITAVDLGSEKNLLAFCRGIQAGSPVDAFVTPEPADMPGYTHKVIMAAGTFIDGSTSEMSADAPLREPYTAYLQGSLSFEYSKIALAHAVMEMQK